MANITRWLKRSHLVEGRSHFVSMKQDATAFINLKLTPEELELLASLASDQLFRREFIDPKMPGYKSNFEEVKLGKALVARLRAIVAPASAKTIVAPASPKKRTAAARMAG